MFVTFSKDKKIPITQKMKLSEFRRNNLQIILEMGNNHWHNLHKITQSPPDCHQAFKNVYVFQLNSSLTSYVEPNIETTV